MTSDVRGDVKELSDLLIKKGLTLSLAESCTGGLVAKYMTDMQGASVFFKGGAITYSNDSKERLLNVPRDTIEKCGAVSARTAEGMAKGVRTIFGTDIAASATGIAGPDGGTDMKPVGTVFIAVTDGKRTESERLTLKGTRDDIRNETARRLIRMLIRTINDI
ncbi:MAG: CinA family protein [Methanomassiliicoccaceae archaeon]|jgi:nicotinamide-nucleotide amidase|nr:CinA family protein [Methanomassiliicoccaceae archaeon]